MIHCNRIRRNKSTATNRLQSVSPSITNDCFVKVAGCQKKGGIINRCVINPGIFEPRQIPLDESLLCPEPLLAACTTVRLRRARRRVLTLITTPSRGTFLMTNSAGCSRILMTASITAVQLRTLWNGFPLLFAVWASDLLRKSRQTLSQSLPSDSLIVGHGPQ